MQVPVKVTGATEAPPWSHLPSFPPHRPMPPAPGRFSSAGLGCSGPKRGPRRKKRGTQCDKIPGNSNWLRGGDTRVGAPLHARDFVECETGDVGHPTTG